MWRYVKKGIKPYINNDSTQQNDSTVALHAYTSAEAGGAAWMCTQCHHVEDWHCVAMQHNTDEHYPW